MKGRVLEAADGGYKKIFIGACVLLLALNALWIFLRYGQSGWDFSIYFYAVKHLADGKDPYTTASVINCPFIYPPLTLAVFKPLLFFGQYLKPLYYLLWSVLLLLSALVVKKLSEKNDPLYLATIFFTGFIAAYWNFRSGNIGLVELFMMAAVFYCLKKEAYLQAAAVVGLLGYFKITPISIAPLFLLLPLPAGTRVRMVLVSGLVFLALYGLSYLAYPGLMPSFFKVVGYPLTETGATSNASSLSLLSAMGRTFSAGRGVVFALYCVYAGLTVLASYFLSRKIRSMTVPESFSLWLLVLMAIWPRIKPYSYIYALIPAYLLTVGQGYRRKYETLLLISLVPMAFHILYSVYNAVDIRLLYSSNVIKGVIWYSQFFPVWFLLAYYFRFAIRERRRQ